MVDGDDEWGPVADRFRGRSDAERAIMRDKLATKLRTTPDAWAKIQLWYAAQCDGHWEHGYGVTIATLDNPGWSVKIGLAERSMQEPRHIIAEREGETDWYVCFTEGQEYHGVGSPNRLETVIDIFFRDVWER